MINDIKCISSAKVNWGKSEALLVGNWSGDLPTLPGGLLWKRGGLNILVSIWEMRVSLKGIGKAYLRK